MKKILSAVLACTATMALATSAFAEDAGATDPATTDAPKTAVIETTVKLADGKIGGADLDKVILTDEDGKTYTWADVLDVVFESEDAFGVSFAADKEKVGVEKFIMGVDELTTDDDETPSPEPDEGDVAAPEAVRADDSARWATEWELTEDYINVFAATPDVTLESESGEEIEVTASVTVKVAAETDDPSNAETGIALAVAPAGLAVAFVAVAAVMSKKKRG